MTELAKTDMGNSISCTRIERPNPNDKSDQMVISARMCATIFLQLVLWRYYRLFQALEQREQIRQAAAR